MTPAREVAVMARTIVSARYRCHNGGAEVGRPRQTSTASGRLARTAQAASPTSPSHRCATGPFLSAPQTGGGEGTQQRRGCAASAPQGDLRRWGQSVVSLLKRDL